MENIIYRYYSWGCLFLWIITNIIVVPWIHCYICNIHNIFSIQKSIHSLPLRIVSLLVFPWKLPGSVSIYLRQVYEYVFDHLQPFLLLIIILKWVTVPTIMEHCIFSIYFIHCILRILKSACTLLFVDRSIIISYSINWNWRIYILVDTLPSLIIALFNQIINAFVLSEFLLSKEFAIVNNIVAIFLPKKLFCSNFAFIFVIKGIVLSFWIAAIDIICWFIYSLSFSFYVRPKTWQFGMIRQFRFQIASLFIHNILSETLASFFFVKKLIAELIPMLLWIYYFKAISVLWIRTLCYVKYLL